MVMIKLRVLRDVLKTFLLSENTEKVQYSNAYLCVSENRHDNT